MGMGFHHDDWGSPEEVRRVPTLNPDKFTITRTERAGRFLAASIHYSDCTDPYKERIVIMEDVTDVELASLSRLDPDYSERRPIVATVKPDDNGWVRAQLIMQVLSQIEEPLV